MKKSLLIATGLVLLSTSANATKSRMTALGQDTGRGSHYIGDTRNVFRNAAHAGSTTNYIVTEWGADATATVPSQADGGFFKEAGAFNYGVYLNDRTDSQNDMATANGTTTGYGGSGTAFGATGFADRSDNLDLFFAGDMGFQWGARIGYTASNVKSGTPATAEKTHDGMSLGLGIIMGDIEGSLNMVLKDDYENDAALAGGKAEGSGMNVDLGYTMGSWKFFGSYATKGMDYTANTATAKTETSQNTISLGAGHTHEVSSSARIYSDVSYNSVSGEDKILTATNEENQSNLKVNMAFEADATSWLTWRGSVSQNVMIDKDETVAGTPSVTDEQNSGSTNISAGVTLNFGKLKVDGTVSSSDADIDLGDDAITEVAVHYWF